MQRHPWMMPDLQLYTKRGKERSGAQAKRTHRHRSWSQYSGSSNIAAPGHRPALSWPESEWQPGSRSLGRGACCASSSYHRVVSVGAREQQQQARSRVTIPLLLQPTARVLRACRGQLQWGWVRIGRRKGGYRCRRVVRGSARARRRSVQGSGGGAEGGDRGWWRWYYTVGQQRGSSSCPASRGEVAVERVDMRQNGVGVEERLVDWYR